MATATKTPAKRATSQINAAAAAKSTRTSARAVSGAVTHQGVSFERVLEGIRPERVSARAPVYQVASLV